MTHPVVIMSYDKSPAITKAVAALEEAGMEVMVLNTKTAKLVDFLGALAGEDPDAEDEDAEGADDAAPAEELPADTEPAPAEDDELAAAQAAADEEEEPLATEALIAGEKVAVKIVEGSQLVLHPTTISIGAKTFYSLNEAQFAFWPSAVSNEPVTGGVELEVGKYKPTTLTKVTFGEAANPAVLEVGRDWLKEVLK